MSGWTIDKDEYDELTATVIVGRTKKLGPLLFSWFTTPNGKGDCLYVFAIGGKCLTFRSL